MPDSGGNMTKTAYFRFYAELNDFLPAPRRQSDIRYDFSNTPAVKDVIESLGVPHTEVDLIIANAVSVDFSYLLQDNDRIAVYPVFEGIDIAVVNHLRPQPLRKVQFVLDVHLGKLAKLLRMCGFDGVYANHLSDPDIINIANTEKRIILTRDKGLLKNKIVTHGYWLRATNPKQQLQEVISRFDLINMIKPFSVCLACNGKIKKVAKQDVVEQLPPRTASNYQQFYRCQQCHKVYWQGSHYEDMQTFLQTLK